MPAPFRTIASDRATNNVQTESLKIGIPVACSFLARVCVRELYLRPLQILKQCYVAFFQNHIFQRKIFVRGFAMQASNEAEPKPERCAHQTLGVADFCKMSSEEIHAFVRKGIASQPSSRFTAADMALLQGLIALGLKDKS